MIYFQSSNLIITKVFNISIIEWFSIFSKFQFKNKMWSANGTVQANKWPIGIMACYKFFAYEVVVLEFAWFQKYSYAHASLEDSFVDLILDFNTNTQIKDWEKTSEIQYNTIKVYILTQNDGKLSKMLFEDYFFQLTCLFSQIISMFCFIALYLPDLFTFLMVLLDLLRMFFIVNGIWSCNSTHGVISAYNFSPPWTYFTCQ